MEELCDFIYPGCLVWLVIRDQNWVLLVVLLFPSVYNLPGGSLYELGHGTACLAALFTCKEESRGCFLNLAHYPGELYETVSWFWGCK